MPNDVTETARDRIRVLNGDLRVRGDGGTVLLTAGVAALGVESVHALRAAIAIFDVFNADNDPYGKHDCAVVRFGNARSYGRSTITIRPWLRLLWIRRMLPSQPVS